MSLLQYIFLYIYISKYTCVYVFFSFLYTRFFFFFASHISGISRVSVNVGHSARENIL